ncbi:MAG TPA: AarF/UbiB family protein [Longimicrobiales bacterium]|nr:AarF/UbiB family protein [Longimicrobiales bacterium]
MKRWRRALVIVTRLTPFLLAFLRDRRRWILFGGRPVRKPGVHEKRAEKLTATLAALGPTFIKLAQVFSARADILPEPYLSAIGRLQDRVPPVPPESIIAVIESELGRPVDEVFHGFDREPVAAASLGQVHRARILIRAPVGSGTRDGTPPERVEEVAVKVLRPGVEELVAVDLDISFRLLFLLNILFPNHHVRALTNVVREFSVRVREEMDFREEAAHMALFHKHFEGDLRVRAPRVYDAYTRRRVLVMEWVQGDKVDRLADRFAAGELSFTRLMETLTEVYLRMLLVAGFVHADPHPGNILVTADGTIVFLDWGMVVQLSRSHRDAILRTALAAGREDLDGMINGMYELGMIETSISRAEIRDAAAEIMEILGQTREFGPRRVQEMVQRIMNTFYTWPLILPQELVYFFRAAALLEGIGFRYDPHFNGLELARTVIRRMRGELLRATLREPSEVARGLVDEVRATLQAVREVLRRAEREEFRVRIHPRDQLHMERFLMLQVRRILLSLFAVTTALITAITFLALRSIWLLVGGLGVALFMFIIVLFVPSHLLENPLRHARGLRPPGR